GSPWPSSSIRRRSANAWPRRSTNCVRTTPAPGPSWPIRTILNAHRRKSSPESSSVVKNWRQPLPGSRNSKTGSALDRVFIFLGSTAAWVGVGLGAFGAHGLREKLSEPMMAVYQTAVQYHLIHALGLILIGCIVQ